MQQWEAELINRVSTEKGWQLVEAFSKQMRCMPEEVERGAEIIAQTLKDSGISPVVHRPEIYLGIPVSATIGAGSRSITAKASALSPAVDGLVAPLIHLKAKPSQQGVHPGDPNALFERRFDSVEDAVAAISGKIVLTEGLSNPARTQLLQSWGAVATIVINPGDRSHWGTNSVIWGSPVGDEIEQLPKIASVAVSRAEGDALVELAADGATVTLDVDALHGWFEQPVVTAEIKGDGPEAEDFVLLHSHYDSWEYGVGDNATGNAVVLEVARLLSRLDKPLRRSVRFAWWPGHSAGRYAGSSWYADAFGADMARNCIAHVNCDSPGCADATYYGSIRSMSEAAPLLKEAVRALFDQVCTTTRPGRAGDYSFNNLGITGTMLTSSMVPPEERKRRGWYAVGGCGGSPAWHSEYDTIEVADRGVLENDIKLYGLVVARLAGDAQVPLDYAVVIDEIREHLAEAAVGRLGSDALSRIDTSLVAAREKLAEVLSGGSVDALSSNRLQKWMSRHLVQMNYAIGPSHVQDPARSFGAVPLLSDAPTTQEDSGPMGDLARLRAQNGLQSHADEILKLLDLHGV